MESTADKLKGMDGTAFEQFCGPVLRKMEPQLAGFLESGVNEAGKTIRSLMDGFCFVTGSHLVTVHITTTQEKSLVTKWLYDGDAPTMTEGDLTKAIRQAKEIHSESPHFTFTIYLVYSGRVPEDVHIKAHQLITDSFIQLKIIEGRNFVSFLDLEPEGLYLRKKLLGISGDRISKPLLNDLSCDNLSRYAKEYYLEQENITMTSLIEMVDQKVRTSEKHLHLLTADSGFGKSSICFLLLQKAIDCDQAAIRLGPVAIERASSLEDAIWQQLLIDHPNLYREPEAIQSLFTKALVVIDDINKASNATGLLDKIISWEDDAINLSVTVVCAVWPRNINALDNKLKKEVKYNTVSLLRPSYKDCKNIIERRIDLGVVSLTEQQIHALILDTGFDPLLLDFSLQLLSKKKQFSDRIAGDAIDGFVNDKIELLHRETQLPVHTIKGALVFFGKAMLLHQKMNPRLVDLQQWAENASENYKVLYMLAAQRQLLMFSEDGQCHFRHDRVLDQLLMYSAVELLGDPKQYEKVLGDPFHAEIIASAISTTDLTKDNLEFLINVNPLAVFGSLKYLQDPSHESRLTMVMETCEAWSGNIVRRQIPPSVTNEIAYVLTLFDIRDIERVTKGFPQTTELQLAKFRNGVWKAGLQFLKSVHYFYPESPGFWWGSVLAHVKSKYSDSLIREFQQSLNNALLRDTILQVYTLAGFYRDNRLMGTLIQSWTRYKSPDNYVPYLWAILNCFTANDRATVKDTLLYFNSLTDEQRLSSKHSRLPGGSNIRLIETINWQFTEEQLAILFELGEDPDLLEILALLLSRTDHPAALAIVLNKEMTRNEEYYWQERNDERWDISIKSPNLSDSSRNYLLQEFSDLANHQMRRYVAWRFWTGNTESGIVLEKLQEFTNEDDPLFYHCILWRADHHDHTAFQPLRKFIQQKPWLVRALDDIWNEETAEFFKPWFEERLALGNKEEIEFGLELLEMIDNPFAADLLLKNWELIRRYVKGITLALFLSTSETIKLADVEIKRLGFTPGQRLPHYYYGNVSGTYISWNDGIINQTKEDLHLLSELFKHLGWRYGVKYSGKPERLTRKKIETLIPYLELMDRHSIQEFSKRSIQIGAPDLCFTHFYPLLGRHERSRVRPTMEDVKLDFIDMFKDVEKNGKAHLMGYWMYDGNKLGVTQLTFREAAQTFLNEYKNAKAFFVVAMALERLGTREDIAMMDSFHPEIATDVPIVTYWRENAKFLIRRRSLN